MTRENIAKAIIENNGNLRYICGTKIRGASDLLETINYATDGMKPGTSYGERRTISLQDDEGMIDVRITNVSGKEDGYEYETIDV